MHERTALPIHPRTGLSAVGIVNGRPVWPILGGSDDDGAGEGGGTATKTDPPRAWTPPTSQEELERIINKAVGRAHGQYGMTADEAKAYKTRVEALEGDLASETDKAVKAARNEARAEIQKQAVPRVVKAEFKAEAKGVLTADQLDALLEDLDLTRYADDDGEPDTAKIAAKVAKFAPAKDAGHGKPPPRPLGQGNHNPAQPSARDLGRAEAEKRFGKKQ